MSVHLSEHFTLEKATFSETAERLGIDNSHPPAEIITTASRTAIRLEKVRELLGQPIRVSSWIRCLELNRVLKSKDTSQHLRGEAVDFTCAAYGIPAQIARYLRVQQALIRYDQLILEHKWVHISWNSIPNTQQRGEVLSLLKSGGYANGLTDSSGNTLEFS